IVRDGRDVALSMDAFSATSSWVPADRAEQVRTWTKAVERGDALRASALGTRIRLVRYEDLLERTEAILIDLLGFLELDASRSTVRLMIERSRAENALFRGPGLAINRAVSGDG